MIFNERANLSNCCVLLKLMGLGPKAFRKLIQTMQFENFEKFLSVSVSFSLSSGGFEFRTIELYSVSSLVFAAAVQLNHSNAFVCSL